MDGQIKRRAMTAAEQKEGAKKFLSFWQGKGYEKGQSQPFWISLLRDVLGVEEPEKYIEFEDKVMLDHTSFIDAMIPVTHVMIEQKELHKDLRKAIKQSDGTLLKPYQQALRYAANLPYSKRPRYIVTCNFSTFLIYDMEHPQDEPAEVQLADLPKEYYRLEFLVDTGNAHVQKEMELSLQAGELVGKLYDALLKEYHDPADERAQKSLNMLCVRLVFCLYAEDAGIFGSHTMFHDYLKSFPPDKVRRALLDLFKILDTKIEDRDPYLEDDLGAFPYVNGGLFSDESIIIPTFTEEIVTLLTEKASVDFDWSGISPTIFGAVFESTLNPATRRSGGMHYTSIENIHKVIDPLFLDDLKAELQAIKEVSVKRTRERKLRGFQEKLANLTFFDPACGSGNFLTETYLSLRRLENKVLDELTHGMMVLGELDNPIKVSIHQFYGIEINDFAVTVAKTALWISEAQMMEETESIVHMNLDFLPLKEYANIAEGNALCMKWEDVVPKEKVNYIMGNPPFVGYSLQSKEQKADILSVYVDEKGKPYKKAGKIDYVAGWYFKAAQFMQDTSIHAAFVSTNSITQGEQTTIVWKPIFERFDCEIDFAHLTFKWDNESTNTALVYCVIIGYSKTIHQVNKKIFTGSQNISVNNINAYLMDAPNIFIEARKKALCAVPEMLNGGKPAEGGYLILSIEEKNNLVSETPLISKFLRPYMMGQDFINRVPRYCLWLVHAKPDELRKFPFILKRIKEVKDYRLQSKKADTRKKANTPMLFSELRECKSKYIAIPKVTSGKRRYIPIDYLSADVIAGDKLFMIPNATIYHFGVLTSNVHMAWMRTVCSRYGPSYSYSNTLVYNNFPWPTPTEVQKEKIKHTAQAILDARALYPDSSLADLYDELTMPPELRKAHQENDKAVMEAYGWKWRGMTEADCVAKLMTLYQQLTAE